VYVLCVCVYGVYMCIVCVCVWDVWCVYSVCLHTAASMATRKLTYWQRR